jgi:ribose transport system substrate-binding protein
MKNRRWIASIAALALTAIAIAAASAATGSTHARSAPAKKFRIALANSFIGNTWRVEMENLFKAGCKMPPYNETVDCSVYNSGNDVAKQTQQISNLISLGVDAIVINAASPTGLNGIIKQACARGIVVVSFDNVVTAPCAQTVNTNQFKFGQQGAQFLVDQLHGKGNVIMVTGVAGTFADHERNRGVDSVFKKNPGIHVAARYSGNWDSSAAQRATAAQLPSLPKIDGVWVSGGTDGVLKAFVSAGKPLPVTAGEGENGFRRFLLRSHSRSSRTRRSSRA